MKVLEPDQRTGATLQGTVALGLYTALSSSGAGSEGTALAPLQAGHWPAVVEVEPWEERGLNGSQIMLRKRESHAPCASGLHQGATHTLFFSEWSAMVLRWPTRNLSVS